MMNGGMEQPVLVLLVKCTILLIAGMVAARVFRRASSSALHLLWASVIVGVLLLPLFARSLPPWRVAYASKRALVSTSPLVKSFSPSAGSSSDVQETTPPHNSQTAHSMDEAPLASPASSLAEPSRNTSMAAGRGHSLSAATVFAVFWAIGCLFLLSRLAFGLHLVARARRSSLALDASTAALVREVKESAGIGRFVDVRRSAEGGVALPITWGFVRPVILLPAQSQSWSCECLRSVLLHEFAHIKRGDWLTQCAAHLACALYWFHPLAWLASRQMRECSERACDDFVLGVGVAPAEYAQRLVDVLKSIPPYANPRTVAIAMALPRETEGRIRAVLASGLNRRSLSRKRIWAASVLVTAVVLPLSALRPIARAADKIAAASAPAPVVHHHSRGLLEFLYLRDVSGKRYPNQRVTLSIERGKNGDLIYQFFDRLSRQTFSDTGRLPALPPGGLVTVTAARKAEFRSEVRSYNRWRALMMSSPMILTDADIVTAQAKLGGANGHEPVLKITLNADGAKKFSAFTAAHTGEIMGIVSDARLLTAPNITMPINNGTLEMGGCFRTMAQAQALASRLNEPDPVAASHNDFGALASAIAVSDNAFANPILAQRGVATLPNGAQVSLDGVSRAVREGKLWNMSAGAWRSANGAPIASPDMSSPRHWTRPVDPKDPGIPYRLCYSFKSAARDRSNYFEFPNALGHSVVNYSNGRIDQEMRLESISPSAQSLTVRIGVSTAPWRTVATLSPVSSPAFTAPGAWAQWPNQHKTRLQSSLILSSEPSLWYPGAGGRLHNDLILSRGSSLGKLARRIVAVYKNGVAVPLDDPKRPEIISTLHTTDEDIFTLNPTLVLANIKAFQIQVRPYQVAEFRNIPLVPNPGVIN